MDGSDNSMRAANAAISLAERHGSEVAAVHIVNFDQYLQSLGLYRVSYPTGLQKKVDEAKAEADKWFESMKKTADKSKVAFHGSVVDTPLSVVAAILNFAENEKGDLIVIGTRGRSGFARLVLGSIASGVVTYASCPVLVVR